MPDNLIKVSESAVVMEIIGEEAIFTDNTSDTRARN